MRLQIFVECMITNAPIFFVSIYSVDDQFSSLIVRRLQKVFLIYTITGQLYQGTLSSIFASQGCDSLTLTYPFANLASVYMM